MDLRHDCGMMRGPRLRRMAAALSFLAGCSLHFDNPIETVPSGSIRGAAAVEKVSDGKFLPARGVCVSVAGTNLVVFTDGRGNFEVLHLAPGSYDLTLHLMPESGTGQVLAATVARVVLSTMKDAIDTGTTRLSPAGRMSGKVAFAGEVEESPKGVRVALAGTSFSALTDENGEYTIEGIPPGRYLAAAFKRGYQLGVIADFEIVPDWMLKDMNFELEKAEDSSRTGRISGSVSLAGNTGKETRLYINIPDIDRTLNAIEGDFSFTDIPEGIFSVKALSPEYLPVTVMNVPSAPESHPLGSPAFHLLKRGLSDCDGDGITDDEDTDNDNDGRLDADEEDAFIDDPTEWHDGDGDGIGDNADTDDDNDGLPDAEEFAEGSDPENPDTDGDGVKDGRDNCPLKPNQDQKDSDVPPDGIGDDCDPDYWPCKHDPKFEKECEGEDYKSCKAKPGKWICDENGELLCTSESPRHLDYEICDDGEDNDCNGDTDEKDEKCGER